MPSTKKKSAKKNKDERRAKREASLALHEHASTFRQLLLTARQEYSKGRSYDAVECQKKALAFGSAKLSNFDDYSLVKAHALVELGLALSAVMTDFARGEEWTQVRSECEGAFAGAIQIFEHRLKPGRPVQFRADECWVSGEEYQSPVPHAERLGPVDYMSCAVMAVGGEDPSKETVQTMERAIMFGKSFVAHRCVIQLHRGLALSGEMPSDMMDRLSVRLKLHRAVLDGKMTKEAYDRSFHEDITPEVRHEGTRLGKMRLSDKKLVKDIDKEGLRECFNPDCSDVERQPMQFSTCSRCKWATYCSKECQSTDWKRHKMECKTAATQERAAYEEQNKDESSLLFGQSQQLLVIVRYLHHYATISEEMMSTRTVDAAQVRTMVLPILKNAELGTVQLGMQEVGLVWNALWSMDVSDRDAMIQGLLAKVPSFGFPSKLKGGPDFSVIAGWGSLGIAGDFVVVKHTRKGSILLHGGDSTDEMKAYLVVGISQSIKSLLEPMNMALPVPIRTAILPYKKLIVCQGAIMPSFDAPPKLWATAMAYTKGEVEMDVVARLD